MVKTYKYKSKIATAIAFLAGLITYLGKDGLSQYLPPEWLWIVPILVYGAGYILTQGTENIRVEVAEQMLLEKFGKLIPVEDVDPSAEYDNLNEEYTVDGDDDGC